ncbi:SDR family NAD(P)-dependent oxidoreductase [Tritonibacter horizontis]|uniref:GDP-L-fucose synthase n=1 Tax=Tritonibacter horizontis TaxID=1768241 RepID=A0A132BYW1_9RHOB|nr:SDR family NAD(P)-dependent oxidoreductase [Tritonibacter horizontis]KUP93474.1 GDP-L-fucose synthase [Tritonibacter horizontis]
MKDYYSGKSVLVTGGASFIGSHLCESLVDAGARVSVVDDLSSGRKENLSLIQDQITFFEEDLREYTVCKEVTSGQDIVFHLANIHGGRGFIETHPAEISQNLVIDGNMLRASHHNSVDHFSYTSSACVYPTNLQVSDTEMQERYLSEEMANPFIKGAALADGEYGWAKLMGEMALSAYGKQFGLKGVSCRLFTVYGPRENESHAIIAFIAKAVLGMDPFEVWGSGKQDRNFTYVSDVVNGLMLATMKINDCRAVNIGTNEITTIADAARLACEIVGHTPSKGFFFDTSKPEGVHARAASTMAQQDWLGWSPEVSFEDGLRETIQWYTDQVDRGDLAKNLPELLFER